MRSKFGGGAPPYEVVRLSVCERMHWTFKEYDDTPISATHEMLEIWKLDSESKAAGG